MGKRSISLPEGTASVSFGFDGKNTILSFLDNNQKQIGSTWLPGDNWIHSPNNTDKNHIEVYLPDSLK